MWPRMGAAGGPDPTGRPAGVGPSEAAGTPGDPGRPGGRRDIVAASWGAEEPAAPVARQPGESSPAAGREAAAAAPESAEEQRLLAALRRGDEAAFVALVERYHGRLLRLAQLYVPNRAIAEEVV